MSGGVDGAPRLRGVLSQTGWKPSSFLRCLLWARVADLAGKDATARDRAAATLRHWQGDADLSRVRHPWSLLRLPSAERRQWQKFWANVDELLKKASNAGM